MAKIRGQLAKPKNAVLFFAVFAVWEILDRITKAYFDSALGLGQSAEAVPGLFCWTLVHNTGGAWGMLSDATFALGVFSLIVSLVLAIFAIRWNEGATWVETTALALVVAGGFGNAVDRFALGYVVDFINVSFIDFPVFNVADIGVTVGMVVFFVALLVRTLIEAKRKPVQSADLGDGIKTEGAMVTLAVEDAPRTEPLPDDDDGAEVVAILGGDAEDGLIRPDGDL